MRGYKNLKQGDRRFFDYPAEFVTLPEYSLRRGAAITVIRPLQSHEYDREPGGERMYEIEDNTGWVGVAWEGELRRVAP